MVIKCLLHILALRQDGKQAWDDKMDMQTDTGAGESKNGTVNPFYCGSPLTANSEE